MNKRLLRNWTMKFSILSLYSMYVLLGRGEGQTPVSASVSFPMTNRTESQIELRQSVTTSSSYYFRFVAPVPHVS